jgi:TolA-binding protein
MNSARRSTRLGAPWALAAGLAAMSAMAAAAPAWAQDAGQVYQPAPAGGAPNAEPGVPAATPMTDLLTRMDAVEAQVARLTAQNEELAHRQRQLEAKLAAADAATSPATTAATSATPPSAAAPTSPAPLSTKPATASNLSAMTGGASDRSGDAGPAHPSAQRIAAVKAVIKPQTGDAALDDYSYGYRLYTAKFYPEAAQQLQLFIKQYPKDAHLGYARNLIGRAFLDDGKPEQAAPWFLLNYKADQHGPRAPDSLLYLAESLRQMGKTDKACIALNEFSADFAPEAQGRLRPDYTRTRSALTCS